MDQQPEGVDDPPLWARTGELWWESRAGTMCKAAVPSKRLMAMMRRLHKKAVECGSELLAVLVGRPHTTVALKPPPRRKRPLVSSTAQCSPTKWVECRPVPAPRKHRDVTPRLVVRYSMLDRSRLTSSRFTKRRYTAQMDVSQELLRKESNSSDSSGDTGFDSSPDSPLWSDSSVEPERDPSWTPVHPSNEFGGIVAPSSRLARLMRHVPNSVARLERLRNIVVSWSGGSVRGGGVKGQFLQVYDEKCHYFQVFCQH